MMNGRKMKAAQALDEAAREDIIDIIVCRLYGKNNGVSEEVEELLDSYIDEVVGRALRYCHIPALPEGLNECVAAMCIDLLKSEGTPLHGAALSGSLEEIKLGDARFGLGSASSVSQEIVDSLLRNYALDLHRYRRLA